jgi:hypothetical protein
MVSTGYELSGQISDLSLDCGQPKTNLLKPGSPCGIWLFPFLREPSDTDGLRADRLDVRNALSFHQIGNLTGTQLWPVRLSSAQLAYEGIAFVPVSH